MRAYVEFQIEEGAYDISCPEAKCDQDGIISLKEIGTLVTSELVEKHHKFRLNRGLIYYLFNIHKKIQRWLNKI
jgi:E3 ubiquitin-protein ligase RNF144